MHVVLGRRRWQQGRERIAAGANTVVVVIAAVVVIVVRNWTLAWITVAWLMVSGVPVVGLRPTASHF